MHNVNFRPKLINVGGLMGVFVLILLMSSIKTSSVLPAAAQETSVAEFVYGSVSGPGFFPHETGIGGYVIEISSLYGERFGAGKVISDTSLSLGEPQAEISFDYTGINGLHLYKNLTAPDGSQFNITITSFASTNVIARDLKLRTSEIYAMKVMTDVPGLFPENYWTTEPENDLLYRLGADQIPSIEKSAAKYNAHSLTAGNITIPGFFLSVEKVHKSSFVN